MKKRRILLAFVLSVGLFASSCSSGDNDGQTVAPLSGTWLVSKVGTSAGGTEYLVDAPQNQSGCDRDYLDLNLNNTCTEGDYDSTVSACALTTHNGTWVRANNDLTTIIEGNTVTKEIINLTLSELKLKDSSGALIVYIRG